MTLGNMRANGVRSLAVSCRECHHEAVLSADRWPDHVPVPSFGPRVVRTRCGIIGDRRTNGTSRSGTTGRYCWMQLGMLGHQFGAPMTTLTAFVRPGTGQCLRICSTAITMMARGERYKQPVAFAA